MYHDFKEFVTWGYLTCCYLLFLLDCPCFTFFLAFLQPGHYMSLCVSFKPYLYLCIFIRISSLQCEGVHCRKFPNNHKILCWINIDRGPYFLGLLYHFWLFHSFCLLLSGLLIPEGRDLIETSCVGLSNPRSLTSLHIVGLWISIFFPAYCKGNLL